MQVAGLHRFRVGVAGVKWVPNFDRTRWFLVLELGRPEGDELNALLRAVNRCASAFGLPMLYCMEEVNGESAMKNRLGVVQGKDTQKRGEQRSLEQDYTSNFHVSIAWQLAEPTASQKDQIVAATRDLLEAVALSMPYECVKVKIGNAVHDVHLSDRRPSIRGPMGT